MDNSAGSPPPSRHREVKKKSFISFYGRKHILTSAEECENTKLGSECRCLAVPVRSKSPKCPSQVGSSTLWAQASPQTLSPEEKLSNCFSQGGFPWGWGGMFVKPTHSIVICTGKARRAPDFLSCLLHLCLQEQVAREPRQAAARCPRRAKLQSTRRICKELSADSLKSQPFPVFLRDVK